MKKLLLGLLLIVSFNCIGQTDSSYLPKYISTANWIDSLKKEGVTFSGLGSIGVVTSSGLYLRGGLTDDIYNTKVVSKYDTTVIYGGMPNFKHTHVYARKNNKGVSYASCAVYHGLEGCPDTWEDFNLICKDCLRHIRVKESRTLEITKSEYDEALEKLNNLLKIK